MIFFTGIFVRMVFGAGASCTGEGVGAEAGATGRLTGTLILLTRTGFFGAFESGTDEIGFFSIMRDASEKLFQALGYNKGGGCVKKLFTEENSFLQRVYECTNGFLKNQKSVTIKGRILYYSVRMLECHE